MGRCLPEQLIASFIESRFCCLRFFEYVLGCVFSDPISLPDSHIKLKTLGDAGAYILKLPKAEREAKEWQTAMHCLIEAADNGGPIEFARMGMLQALNRNVERVLDTSRKEHRWARRKLTCDR
jgi:hypothetical protein